MSNEIECTHGFIASPIRTIRVPTKLVKCANCGGKPKLRHMKNGMFRARCNKCGAYVSTPSKVATVVYWNNFSRKCVRVTLPGLTNSGKMSYPVILNFSGYR